MYLILNGWKLLRITYTCSWKKQCYQRNEIKFYCFLKVIFGLAGGTILHCVGCLHIVNLHITFPRPLGTKHVQDPLSNLSNKYLLNWQLKANIFFFRIDNHLISRIKRNRCRVLRPLLIILIDFLKYRS